MPMFYEFFAGGGMARAGLGKEWSCSFANDFSEQKAKSYLANWGSADLLVEDVEKLNTSHLPGIADLAWASFPCQDLSLAGNGAGLDGKRSGSFWGFMKLIQELRMGGRKPSMIVLENVYGTLTANEGKDFAAICSILQQQEYRFGAMVVDAVHFVPQSRPRVFFVCVDRYLDLPKNISDQWPSRAWHPDKLIRAFNKLPADIQAEWLWWQMPSANLPFQPLETIVDLNCAADAWHSPSETQRLMSLMSQLHRDKVAEMQQTGDLRIGTIYKRTRNGEQRAEVRFDGIAGCLRTPGGGSSRQTIIVVEGNQIRTRLITTREAARLMGLPDEYLLPEKYNEAYHLVGDGVVVPVVAHINRNILLPVFQAQQKLKKNVA